MKDKENRVNFVDPMNDGEWIDSMEAFLRMIAEMLDADLVEVRIKNKDGNVTAKKEWNVENE